MTSRLFLKSNHLLAFLFGLLCFGSAAIGAVLFSNASAPQSGVTAQPVNIDQLPKTQVLREDEWREARQLESGSHSFDLGIASPGDSVRFSVALRRPSKTMPRVRLVAGDSEVKEFTLQEVNLWNDFRITLPANVRHETACRLLVDSPTSLWIAACELVRQEPRRPNVLVFLVDTLRPDHLGAYGYGRNTSPVIDSLAADGITFTQVVSQSSWTRPAVASFLTSTYSVVHGAKDRADVLRGDLPTVAEAFQAVGYETVALMSNPSCLPVWGFGRGFSRYVDVDSSVVEPDKDAKVVNTALDVLQNLAGRPWFLYCHAIGPHSPYEPPAPYDRQFVSKIAGKTGPASELAHLVDLYDGEIAFTDKQFGRLINALKHTGQYDNTMIVVMSDHGEAFGEHGEMGHGTSLYDVQIRVPLIVKFPRKEHAGAIYGNLVELIDVAPTLLEALGVSIPDRFQGRSLAKAVAGNPSAFETDKIAYASLFLEKKSLYTARTASLKYVEDVAENDTHWYDLAADPAEDRPLPQEPNGGERLVRHASRIVSSDGAGLHILVTGSLRDNHTVSGTLKGAQLGAYDMHYLAENSEVLRDGDSLSFRITTSPGANAPMDLVEWHETSAEQNNAHLRVAAPADTPLELTVLLDGRPMPADQVFVGSPKTPRPLDHVSLSPSEITAESTAFFPDALPRKLAVYVWYVPPVDTVADEDLDPAMAGALRALGYL